MVQAFLKANLVTGKAISIGWANPWVLVRETSLKNDRELFFSSSLRERIELSKYVYFCAQISMIKAGNNKFQGLINVPR